MSFTCIPYASKAEGNKMITATRGLGKVRNQTETECPLLKNGLSETGSTLKRISNADTVEGNITEA